MKFACWLDIILITSLTPDYIKKIQGQGQSKKNSNSELGFEEVEMKPSAFYERNACGHKLDIIPSRLL